ncbi:uncharacterized protein LOC143424296 [Xylocopa sonorina]|uniref:uncharacterized protein LOC143424296 n=1 Tax=Xylocopa sonorina TaxID=1818115 RepID=UPI00403A800A
MDFFYHYLSRIICSSVSELSDYAIRTHHTCLKPNAKCIQHQRSRSSHKHRTMDIARMRQCMHTIDLRPTVRFHDQKLQVPNEYLRNQLSQYQENHKRNMDNYLSSSISRLTTDVSTLKAKLTEMQKLKNSMEESYKEAVQEYHFTVLEQFTELKHQLDKAQLKNDSLDNSVAEIAKKLEKIVHGKDNETKAVERQWIDKIKSMYEQFDLFTKKQSKELDIKQSLLEKRDVELLEKDAGRKKEIELLINKIHDLEMKLEIKIRDEDKLQSVIAEQYAMMKEEFNKMRIEVDHETQKQNQNLMSQISALKKAITKLEKTKEKLESDYEKRLSHIIKNKDMEIRALQLRLKEQKNELCASLSTKKQNEVDNMLSILEKRYRMLLAETEAMSETQTQEYLRRIANLEDQVLNMKKL